MDKVVSGEVFVEGGLRGSVQRGVVLGRGS